MGLLKPVLYIFVVSNITFPMTKQMHVSGILPPRSLHNSHMREFTAACLLFILVSRETHHWFSDSPSIFLVLWISSKNICNFFVVFLGHIQETKELKWNSWRGAGEATCELFSNWSHFCRASLFLIYVSDIYEMSNKSQLCCVQY